MSVTVVVDSYELVSDGVAIPVSVSTDPSELVTSQVVVTTVVWVLVVMSVTVVVDSYDKLSAGVFVVASLVVSGNVLIDRVVGSGSTPGIPGIGLHGLHSGGIPGFGGGPLYCTAPLYIPGNPLLVSLTIWNFVKS